MPLFQRKQMRTIARPTISLCLNHPCGASAGQTCRIFGVRCIPSARANFAILWWKYRMGGTNDIEPKSADALPRLVPLTWPQEFAVILGGLAVSFFLFGFFNPYWRVTDQDILIIYDAFLQNDGLPRQITFHPAHLIVTALSTIYRALHDLGLLNSYSLSTLPPASDANAFNQAWTDVVRIARLLSLSIVMAYVTAFGFLLRRLVQDWRVAVLGMFALAYSGGIAMGVRTVKPELMSGALVAIALLILLIAARSPRTVWRPLLVGAAALSATLALDNKVQAIFLICALPVLLLPFGEPSDLDGYWSQRRAGWPLAALVVTALLAAAAATPLVYQGLFPGVAFPMMHLVFGAGVFNAMLAVWIGLGMLAFGRLWRVPVKEGLAAAAALVGGIALGLLPLYIHREAISVATVINPIDALLYHSGAMPSDCGAAHCGPPFALLFHSLGEMLKHHSFFLATSPRPEIFLEWAVIAGIVIAIRRGEYKVALQATFLIGATLGIDTLAAARALKQDYFHFTDPLIIIAAVLLLAKVTSLRFHRWAYPVGAALIALHIVFSQAEPIKHAYLMRSGPETMCSILDGLKRMERFPFCRD